jgi:hypothetical protein
MKNLRYLAACLSLAATAPPTWAADLNIGYRAAGAVPFTPTAPVGVAAEFPRSPLTDFAVNGFRRFDTISEARANCPRDRIVWVVFGSGEYRRVQGHTQLDKDFGAYLCEADAFAEGDRLAR